MTENILSMRLNTISGNLFTKQIDQCTNICVIQDEIERLRGEVVKQSTRNHELSTSCHERIEQLVRTLNSGAAVHQEHELMHTRAQLDIALKVSDFDIEEEELL